MKSNYTLSWSLRILGCFLVLALSTQSGCSAGRQFVGAALPSVQQGVTLVVNGLLDGVFAAVDVESDTGSSDNTGNG